ncbi:MAG TPA: response regulator [Terriglobales bacterium]
MSLRILFADDSMTAQSMGKKILSEAGYEVVAVSNGAAAVKKIAEQKPDIIILDVYMPGYSGLEVCEKVRGSMDTLKTPVLLTYGKMEHYRPEDGHRVRADGVIVKPFEASDLLAIVKKLEERINRAPARVEPPVLVDRTHQQAVVAPPAELPVEIPEPVVFTGTSVHSTVEVPDHMAGNSALGDLLTAEPLSSVPEMSVPTHPISETMPEPPPMPQRTSVPEYEVPVAWRDKDDDNIGAEVVPAPAIAAPEPELRSVPVEREPAAPEPAVSQVAAASEPAVFEPVTPEPRASSIDAPEPSEPDASESYSSFAGSRPLRIPVYQEPESPAKPYEFIPTSTPAPEEIEIPREPQLQETAEETTRNTVADSLEPGLMTTRQQFEWEKDSPSTQEAGAPEEGPGIHFQDIPAEIALHAPPSIPTEAPEPQTSEAQSPRLTPVEESEEPKVTEDDFEARVARAMAAYKTSGPDAPMGSYQEPQPESVAKQAFAASVQEPAPVDYHPPVQYQTSIAESVSTEQQEEPEAVQEEPEVVEAFSEAEYRVPTFEYRPPVNTPEPVQEFEPAPQTAPTEPESVSITQLGDVQPADGGNTIHSPSAPVLESPVRAAAAAAGTGADHHAVSQAVHRVVERLKPELVEEILRELKSKE